MSLLRKKHWQTRALHQFLLDRARVPFAWGTNDCACFAADGILAITGTDIMAELRGYRSEAQANATIAKVTGGTTLQDAVAWCAAKHGMPERQHPLTAQRGDLVLYHNASQLTAGLVHLSGRHVVSPGANGLMCAPITAVARSWSY